MTLLPPILLAIAATWALGGDLRRLSLLEVRLTRLVYASLAIQVVAFSSLADGQPAGVRVAQVASYLLLLAFVLANRRVRGFGVLALGLASNALAIVANGGLMPVDRRALVASGWSLDRYADGVYHNTVLAGRGTHLAFLGDVFALPRLPLAAAMSIGDVILIVGIFIVVYRICSTGVAPVASAVRAPLAVPAFRRFLAIQTLSSLLGWAVAATLVGWAFVHGDGLWGSSAVLVVRGLCGTAATWFGGRLADRLGRTRLLAYADAAQAVLNAGIVVAMATGTPTAVYALYALASLAAASGDASLRAAVVRAVEGDADLLPSANGTLGMARGAAMAVGALGAGLLPKILGAPTVMAGTAAGFTATAVAYGLLRLRPCAADEPAGHAERVRIGAHLVRILPLVAMFATATLGTGLLNAVLPHLLRSGSSAQTLYGVGLGVIGSGLLVGQLLGGLLPAEQVRRRTICVALVCMALAAAVVGATPLLTTTLLALFVTGMFDGVTETVFDTLVQREVPERIHGSVFGAAQASATTTMLMAFALAPIAAQYLEPGRLALVAAAFLAAAGLIGVDLPRPRRVSRGPVRGRIGA
jgi:MFS family permease